MMEFGNPVL